MAIKIKFDSAGQPEKPTFVLAKKSGEYIGVIKAHQIVTKNSLTDGSEITFKVYKEENGEKTPFWEEIRDFRLVYCKEYGEWYEITVEISESNETIKSISGISLGRAELGEIKLFNLDIYNEKDILLREDDYKPTIFLDLENPRYSLLHRILDKAPHYDIKYVDGTLSNIRKTFSFDNTSIIDAFNEVAEEVGCLFSYEVKKIDGKLQRTVSAYDLWSTCNNKNCGFRGDYQDVCPKCGCTDLTKSKYIGKETPVFVTSDELSDEITLTSDTKAMKNCFKLEAGDENITSAVRLLNPNGTDYIWYITDDMRKDMSEELVQKLDEYNILYKYYNEEYAYSFSQTTADAYNSLVRKYNPTRPDTDLDNQQLSYITNPTVGYYNLALLTFDTIDFEAYLTSEFMPRPDLSDTSAEIEGEKLWKDLTRVDVESWSVSDTGIKNAISGMATAIVDARYKVEVISTPDSVHKGYGEYWFWTGTIKITNYSDEHDFCELEYTTEHCIKIYNDFSKFLKDEIDKLLTKNNNNDYSITGIFKKEGDDFSKEMEKYSLNSLTEYDKICRAVIGLLEDRNCNYQYISGLETENPNYEGLYLPYKDKLEKINAELKVREEEINIIVAIKEQTEKYIENTKKELNLETNLGEYWKEFISFRREDKYSNSNFTSDSLSNAAQFDRAKEFYELAQRDIYKSSELQYSISSNLKNLLVIDRFKPLLDYFELGNWIRVQIDRNSDDQLPYKLRLISYEIDYDNLDDINVEFSDVLKTAWGISDQKSIVDKMSSMTTSFSTVQRQASEGGQANNTINDWFQNGLDMTLTQMKNGAFGQEQTWDETGMLFRRWDEVEEEYYPDQLKITNTAIAFTTDNWATTQNAIGKIYYQDTDGSMKYNYGINAETLIGRLIMGEKISLINKDENLIFDENGLQVYAKDSDKSTTSKFILQPSNNNKEILKICKTKSGVDTPVFTVKADGSIDMTGNIKALSLDLTNAEVTGVEKMLEVTGFIKTDGTIGNTPEDGSTGFVVSSKGLLKASNAIIYGSIYSSAGVIGGWSIGNNTIQHKGSDNTYVGVGTNTNAVFYAGGTSSNGTDGKFRVMHDGTMYSTKANIEGNIVAETIRAKGKYQIFSDDSSNPITVIDYTNTNSSNQTFKFGRLSANSYNSKNDIEFVDSGSTRQAIVNTDEFIVNAPVDVSNSGINLYGNSIKGTFGCVNVLYVGGDIGFFLGVNSEGVSYSSLTAIRGTNVRLYTTGGGGVYLGNTGSTAITSDEKLKNISEMDDRYLEFFNKIEPVAYKYKTGHRTHLGFGARAVEQALLDSGLTTEEFAGVLIDENPQLGEDEVIVPEGEEIPEELYSLRYEEFIALNTKVLQQALNRIEDLEEEVKLLKKQLESR